MKDDTILILGAVAVAGIAAWKISGGLSKGLAEIGTGTGAGIREALTGVGIGVAGLGTGAGAGVEYAGMGIAGLGIGAGAGIAGLWQGAGAGIAGLGQGAGGGIFELLRGAGYAVGGANPTDIIRTTLTLGQTYYTDYQGNTFYQGKLISQTSPETFVKNQTSVEPTPKTTTTTPTVTILPDTALAQARQQFLSTVANTNPQTTSQKYSISGGLTAQPITRFTEGKTTAQAQSKQSPTITAIVTQAPITTAIQIGKAAYTTISNFFKPRIQ